MLNRGGSRREICQPFVALLCATLFLSLSLGCGEVTDPVPDGQTHVLKQGFRNPNPAFGPPSLWDRLTYLPSRTWVTTVHSRTVNLPRVENDGSALKNNRTDATVTWVGHSGSVANRSWRRTGTHRPIRLGGEGIEHLGRRMLLARPDFHLPLLDHRHDFNPG
jgi:hypothetical protein